MALATSGMILRTDVFRPLTTKGSELTLSELDQNFVKIFQDIAAKVMAGAVPDYDSANIYSLTQVANYNSRTWTFVNSTPTDGVTPGSDATYWMEIDPSVLVHRQNTDTALAEGTPDAIAASDLKEFYNSRPVRFTGSVNKAVINSLDTTPQVIFTCPPGTGIQFFGCAPLMKKFADGVPFSSSSGEYLAVTSSAGLMAFWSDTDLQGPDSPYSAFLPNYQIVTGDIYLSATFPITGGGPGATIDYEIFYRVVNL